jgi:CheY-like chemotaxis protein
MTDAVLHILLVEDHPADVKLTRRALSRLGYPTRLHVAVDGHEAMDFLLQQGRWTSAPRPKFILLDLNMPRMDGREVLRELDANPALNTIPVIVLTTSSAERDVADSYALCTNSYHVKPVTFDKFVDVLRGVLEYWLNLARTPS